MRLAYSVDILFTMIETIMINIIELKSPEEGATVLLTELLRIVVGLLFFNPIHIK